MAERTVRAATGAPPTSALENEPNSVRKSCVAGASNRPDRVLADIVNLHETLTQKHLTSVAELEAGVDAALSLLVDPAAFYLAAPDDVKRMLLQSMFEAILIIDDKVAGCDLALPFAELLTYDARQALTDSIEKADGALVTYQRRENAPQPLHSRNYLRVERPKVAFLSK